MKTIFHLDMDAFFVSVERIIDPTLEGKAVIIGGDPHGRGVVAACSYEARKFGLHSAMPIRNAFRLCPHGTYIHGHHTAYSSYSELVRNFLEEKLPLVQQASIDEFYFDFTGCEKIYGHPEEFAKKLQAEILEKFHLPCSVGISSNKSVSKIATDLRKPLGITFVPHGKEKEFLAPLAVEKMPGVGKKTFPILHARGFKTLGDIANASPDYLAALLGKWGTDLWNRANGFGSDTLSIEHERKSISKETTFSEDIVNKTEIEKYLFKLTAKVAQLLRKEDWQTSTVSIKLRYSDFSTITRAKTLSDPTDDDKIIFDAALKLFRNAYNRRVGIRLIGVHLSKLEHLSQQEALFESEEMIRKKMLRAVMKIRDKFGYKSIQIGKLGND